MKSGAWVWEGCAEAPTYQKLGIDRKEIEFGIFHASSGLETRIPCWNMAIELRTNTETYLLDGRFDQDRMLEVFEQAASGNAKEGFPLSRIVCRMDWAAEGGSYIDNLVEYESRVNHVWRRHDDAVICTYHLTKFGGDTVIDIMQTPSYGHHRRNSSGKSVLCAAGAVPA